jgi:DedD protein
MDQQPDDYAALKRRLLGRIAFAVVVLAGLLASLAVFDRMNAPEPVPEKVASKTPTPTPAASVPAAKVPDTIKSEQTRPDSPAEEPVASAPAATVPEVSATPQGAAPTAGPGEKPLTKPATGRHALMRSPDATASSAAPRSAPLREPPPSGQAPAAGGAQRGPQPAQVARPLSQAAERAAEKPFALQLGVFSDVANAEELRAKLEKAGIKANIEARVSIGPFATRAEADAARAKLRELGISEALLVGMKGRKAP